jgi:hypothetical protein
MSCFLLFPDRSRADYAFLSKHPDHGIEGFEFRQGKSLAARFPAGAEYAMDPDYPDRRTLYDLQPNAMAVLVVSAAFRALLEGDAQVELLPIRILDHRGKVASADHCIVNPLGFVDCIDTDATVGEPDPLQKDQFGSIGKLVLDPARVPEGRRLFRLRGAPNLFAVTTGLAERLRAAGLRGIDFVAPESYDSALY